MTSQAPSRENVMVSSLPSRVIKVASSLFPFQAALVLPPFSAGVSVPSNLNVIGGADSEPTFATNSALVKLIEITGGPSFFPDFSTSSTQDPDRSLLCANVVVVAVRTAANPKTSTNSFLM